jgi:hypothetical protein
MIDCASGFMQIPAKLEYHPNPAFSAACDHYEYKRMPVGLKGAPSTFQRLMSTFLSWYARIKVPCLSLWLIIFGENLKAQNERLRDVFARLGSCNLKLQPENVNFWEGKFYTWDIIWHAKICYLNQN